MLFCTSLASCKKADVSVSSIEEYPDQKDFYSIAGKNTNPGENINTYMPTSKTINKGSNGVWIGPKWIMEDKSSVTKLLMHLNEIEISRLYVNLGEIKPLDISRNNNQNNAYKFGVYFNNFNIIDEKTLFPDNDYKMLLNFAAGVKNFNKNNNSDFKVMGVINGNEKYDLLNNRDENKKDSLKNIVKTTINFFNSDKLKINEKEIFDGFQLDIEPVSGGNEEFLILLNEIKYILPENQTLSVVISQIGPENDLYICSDSYIRDSIASVLRPGDEITLMAYNLGLSLDDYKKNIADQVYRLVKSISPKNIDSSVYIPLYPENNKNNHHASSIENIENALEGLLLTQKFNGITENISRVIIFNYDELYGTEEWVKGFNDFKNLWINDKYNDF